MPLLFPNGSLQEETVQRSTFGRLLQGEPDALAGFAPSRVPIEDARVIAETGKTHHNNATSTGNRDDRVTGMVFDVSDAELGPVDGYESAFAYHRILTTLASGRQAWVYVHADGR